MRHLARDIGADPRRDDGAILRETKPWREALQRVLYTYQDKARGITRGNALIALAKRVYEDAYDGDSWARAEIANRLDGKPKQQLDVTSENGTIFLQALMASAHALREKLGKDVPALEAQAIESKRDSD